MVKAQTWFGWAGTILRVDLSKGKVIKQPLSRELVHNFIGGRGVNSKMLYDETGPKTDPLGPDNRLIFGTGPLVGTFGPGAGRFTVTAKSPVTGILGDGNAGGFWAPELKFAGYDHIVFQGRAKEPVYLWIDDDTVEIKDAKHLWGRNVWETNEILKKEAGDKEIEIVSIGQAGENLVKFASVMADLSNSASGTGAVMGSKNLKAIAVRGTKSIKVAKPDEYEELIRQCYEEILTSPLYQSISTLGTPVLTRYAQEQGWLPVRNYQESVWDERKAEAISGETLLRDYCYLKKADFSCPTHCGHVFFVREGTYKENLGFDPHYGVSLNPLGANLDIDSLPALLAYTNLVNQYGLDGKETGITIGLAMELYERGILAKEDIGGLELEWGREDVVLELIHRIVKREGFGNILAEGDLGSAKKIGGGAEKHAIHVKGKTFSSTDTRGYIAGTLAHVTATRGADHLRSLPWVVECGLMQPEDVVKLFGSKQAADPRSYHPSKAGIVIYYQNVSTACDCVEICRFNSAWWGWYGGDVEGVRRLFNAVTGANFEEKQMLSAVNRVYNIERAYNVREGIRREDDVPPPRFHEPTPSGPSKGTCIDAERFEVLKDVYYERMGWNKNGVPTKKRLKELNLKYVAEELEKMGIYEEAEKKGD